KDRAAGIRGAIQVIGKRLGDAAPESEVVREIIARIDALDVMMKELLLFARPVTLRKLPTDIVSLVSTTARFIEKDPALGGIAIDVEGSAPPLPADAERLKIVFQNLLLNGAHAMQGRGTIRVDVKAADGMCEIAVRDRGPGIPPGIREKIFTPFFTTKSRGTGLGLPTAKRLVEAHSGRITVE